MWVFDMISGQAYKYKEARRAKNEGKKVWRIKSLLYLLGTIYICKKLPIKGYKGRLQNHKARRASSWRMSTSLVWKASWSTWWEPWSRFWFWKSPLKLIRREVLMSFPFGRGFPWCGAYILCSCDLCWWHLFDDESIIITKRENITSKCHVRKTLN